jgi:hypothetical protein
MTINASTIKIPSPTIMALTTFRYSKSGVATDECPEKGSFIADYCCAAAALSTLRQRISKELHGILFRGPLFFPIEIRAYVGAPCAARLTGEPRLKIGRPDLIGPSVPADRCRVAAMEIGAIDQETTNTRRSHFSERDFLMAAFHVSKSIRLCCQIGRD